MCLDVKLQWRQLAVFFFFFFLFPSSNMFLRESKCLVVPAKVTACDYMFRSKSNRIHFPYDGLMVMTPRFDHYRQDHAISCRSACSHRCGEPLPFFVLVAVGIVTDALHNDAWRPVPCPGSFHLERR